MIDYSSTDMIEASTPDVRATDRWARDLIVKIKRELADAGCVIYDLTEKQKTDAAEIARLRAEVERLRVALGGYPDSDLASLATTLRTRNETLEARVAELEAAASEAVEYLAGLSIGDRLRALLSPKPATKPAPIPEPKCCATCYPDKPGWISGIGGWAPCPDCRGEEKK